MTDLETRLRDGLHADVEQPDIDRFVHDVRRGVAWRRARRASAATALAVVALVGGSVLLQHGRDNRSAPEPITHGPTSSSTTTPSDGAGLHPQVVDVSTAGSAVFRLTSNVGCTACSSVWLRDPTGAWTHLYDFSGSAAYGGRVDQGFGPVEHLAMAADGRDGWAWGRRLWATHDGGHTWSIVTEGPGVHTVYGYSLAVGTDVAWALRRTVAGGSLWRTTLGSDTWQQVTDTPRLHHVAGSGFVGVLDDDRVALQVSGEGGSGSALVVGTTGSWRQVPLPFGADVVVRTDGAGFWASLPEPQRRIRILHLRHGSWVDLGKVAARGWLPLDEHRLLIDRATLVVFDDSGTTATDLHRGGYLLRVSRTSDGTFWLITLGDHVFSSPDGLHWTLQP